MAEIIKMAILVLIGINIGVIFICIAHIHFMNKKTRKETEDNKREKQS